MSWLSLHPDARLRRLAAGTLPERHASRLLAHVRGCPRCARKYERILLAKRLLEKGTFDEASDDEVQLLQAGSLPPLASPPRQPTRTVWFSLGALAAATVALLVLVLRPADDEYLPRGGGPGAAAVFRIFCARPDGSMREAESACAADATLAFAVGAHAPLRHVAVRVLHAGAATVEGPFTIAGTPGAEAPLALTLPLQAQPQEALEVTAYFAPTAEAALQAARGAPGSDVVSVRRTLRVETP